MISREEAVALIKAHTRLLPSEQIDLADGLARVISEDILSPIAHPIFDQSAMDGYCFSHESLAAGPVLKLNGEVQAGGNAHIQVGAGECARIFTGAQIPPSCDTVIMQELTTVEGDKVTLTKTSLNLGANVRYAGEQLNKNDIALSKGTVISSAGIGFLASLGIQRIPVSSQPRIHIICTGNEFAENESDLEKGKIYESNGQMLLSCLNELGIKATYETCIDTLEDLSEMISKHESESDLLLITGGVSVGDYDFTKAALEANDFETIFHKVSQKPGKPILFSAKENTKVFGLPGNPRAVLICYYEYVRGYILECMGSNNPQLTTLQLPISDTFKKKDDKRSYFLAAEIRNGFAALLNVQGSHMLGSMAEASGLVVLPPEPKTYEAGDLVEFHLLNH